MHKSSCFWKPFGIEDVSESQKRLKSAEKYFYRTFFIILSQIELEKVIFSKIWDFLTAC